MPDPQHSLITGGAGFVGSHLAEALLSRGQRVTVIDNLSTGSAANLNAVHAHTHFRFVQGSIADERLLAELVGQADHIYHLAAAVGVKLVADDPVHTIETNIYPTQRLLAAIVESDKAAAARDPAGPRKRLFLASSSEIYGKNPRERWREEDDMVFGPTAKARWAYGCSKAIDEFLALAYARQFGLHVVVGRFFNVVGPRQVGHYGMVVPRFIEQARAGGPVIVYDDGEQVRCFAHVSDVVHAVVDLMHCDAALGEVFNIGSDEPVTIRQLAEEVVRLVNPAATIEHVAYGQAYQRGFEDIRRRVPDLSKLRQTIGYQCRYRLSETLSDILAARRGS